MYINSLFQKSLYTSIEYVSKYIHTGDDRHQFNNSCRWFRGRDLAFQPGYVSHEDYRGAVRRAYGRREMEGLTDMGEDEYSDRYPDSSLAKYL